MYKDMTDHISRAITLPHTHRHLQGFFAPICVNQSRSLYAAEYVASFSRGERWFIFKNSDPEGCPGGASSNRRKGHIIDQNSQLLTDVQLAKLASRWRPMRSWTTTWIHKKVDTRELMRICSTALNVSNIRHAPITLRIKSWESARGTIARRHQERDLRGRLHDAVEAQGRRWEDYSRELGLYLMTKKWSLSRP